MTERDDQWFRLTLFAVRLEGENGWIIDEAPFPLPEVEARIRENGYEIAEIRQISSGLSRRRHEDGSPKVDGPMAWYVRSWGWAYDKEAQCWRAPGEMVCEPAGVPARAESFTVQSGARRKTDGGRLRSELTLRRWKSGPATSKTPSRACWRGSNGS